MARSKKSESSVVSGIDTRDESSIALRACLVVSDSPVKAKLIAEMMPDACFSCDAAGLARASDQLTELSARRPGLALFVIRGSKAVEVAKV